MSETPAVLMPDRIGALTRDSITRAGPGAFNPRLRAVIETVTPTEYATFVREAALRGGPMVSKMGPVELAVYLVGVALAQGIQIGLDAAGASLPTD